MRVIAVTAMKKFSYKKTDFNLQMA